MPDIRASKYVHLHLYTPRTFERMRPADDRMFYSIPPVPDNWTPPWDLIDQLNVFAGSLYLRDYESYIRLCRWLGIERKDPVKNVDATVQRDPVTSSDHDSVVGNTVTDSPLVSVMKLLVIRRKGLPFAETHMGRLIRGQRFTEQDFRNLAWAKPESGHHPACNPQTLHNVTSATTVQDGPASSMLPNSNKRGLQTVEPCDTDWEPPKKRLRA